MKKPKAALALLATLVVVPAAADHIYVDTEILLGWCKLHDVGPTSAPYCTGYVNAVADILAHGIAIHGYRACLPEHVRLVDLRDVVVEALDRHPITDEHAHDWVAKVLAEAFPCS